MSARRSWLATFTPSFLSACFSSREDRVPLSSSSIAANTSSTALSPRSSLSRCGGARG